MTIEVNVHTEADFSGHKTPIVRACRTILSHLDIQHGLLTVVLTDKPTMRRMNEEYAGEDRATDVLSFPSGDLDPETRIPYLGDVLIAVPIAQEQADEKGHDIIDELSLLAIHGTLHLLGYDHTDEESRDRMWSLQSTALNALGIRETIGGEKT
jgi:probable rRNA maturation factor